jgi:inosose dehydratase
MSIKVGCGQLTWPESVPEEQVLSEISAAGYVGAPAHPLGGRSAVETLAVYQRHGLLPAPGYFSADFWRGEQQTEIVAAARRQAQYMRALGCRELFVAANGFDGYTTRRGLTRNQVAGHVAPEDGLTPVEFQQFATTLSLVGAVTLAEGVRSCFHNHVGSVIETAAEIDELLERVDAEVIFLGPDTGHLAWGGVDPAAFCQKYASRIKCMHLKDIVTDVVQRGVAAGCDYQTFCQHGVFTELGEGSVNFQAIIAILDSVGFDGWVIVETDVTQKASAFESATISRNYLRTIGL